MLGVLYFAIAGRNRLVLSPEEEFALTQGEAASLRRRVHTSREEQEAILGGGRQRPQRRVDASAIGPSG